MLKPCTDRIVFMSMVGHRKHKRENKAKLFLRGLQKQSRKSKEFYFGFSLFRIHLCLESCANMRKRGKNVTCLFFVLQNNYVTRSRRIWLI